MKNKKLMVVTSLLLAIVMAFSTFTVAAYDPVPVTEVTTTAAEETTTQVAEEPTTEAPTEETTTQATEETTTEATEETTEEPSTDGEYSEEYWNGYEDGYNAGLSDGEYEGEYEEGFEDGYDWGYEWGLEDGYYAGYYEGYYDAINGNANQVITVFDRWDAFYEDLLERLENLKYTFIDFFEKLFKIGGYAEYDPAEITDTSFIPDASQPSLEGDEAATALCDEFNNLINGYANGDHPEVYITRRFETIVNLVDCTGGPLVKNIAQDIIDTNIVQSDYTLYYYDGEYVSMLWTGIYPEGLTSATKTVNEDGSIDYEFKLIEEATFYDGYDTYAVALDENDEVVYLYDFYHDYVGYTIYVPYLEVDPAAITKAEIVYPGATITAKVDAEGRLASYNVLMPVKGDGEAKISLIKAKASLEGESNIYFDFDYDVY